MSTAAAPPTSIAILEKLSALREGLIELKQDRTTYVKSHDVVRHYDELCEGIWKIYDVEEFEKGFNAKEDLSEGQIIERDLAEDCFMLISLLFLTVGRNNEPPAVYAPSVIIKRLLEHLAESAHYSQKDLEPIEQKLNNMHANVEQGGPLYNPLILAMLRVKIVACQQSLRVLKTALGSIPPEIAHVHQRLVSMRRCIRACEAKPKFSETEVMGYLATVKEIDATRLDGKFVAEDGSIPSEGQEILDGLLQTCYSIIDGALKRQGAIAPGLKPLAEKLMQTKSQLEKLELTQAWSLRETDLYDFYKLVTRIDESRGDGKFLDTEGNTPEEGQTALLYMVRRCYAHIYSLISSSEASYPPVSEALTPVFNQLQTVRRCLKEVQKFGIQDDRELYPYSMKLASIENMRADGRFMVGNDIPEGQGRVNSLLAECFEICHDLRTSCQNAGD
ncbi:unnamed protein product [Tuber melanosporum]|uniref:(Perigord truffle) hypothetical protein n=1 Tax=Tuber melanosporum (strain Mel28) TaxID=656061 RepID=D5G422_TUBMM|nr:uncharacterized protein GSTUM_00003912001 [Tuber melanosporum]CAZ79265.1 unnamed protein product [Tuber melanosporum]